jgi:hypothetical protein
VRQPSGKQLAIAGGVAVLLAAFACQAVLSMRLINDTSDETIHLPAGYTYLKTGQLALNPEHPPLIKELCALPLLFLNPRLDVDAARLKYNPPDQLEFGRRFLYLNNVHVDRLLFWGRLPVVVLSTLLGFYVWLWAAALFGTAGGLMALFLYAFSPTVIAHSRLATMDQGLSCFYFMTVYHLWRHAREGRHSHLIGAGLSLGLALATKFSAVVLLPVILALLGIEALWGSATQAALADSRRSRTVRATAVYGVIALVAVPVVYAAFLFPSDPLFYWKGMRLVNANHNPDYPLYLFGHFKTGGWWYYFIVAFVLKTQTPALISLAAALFLARRRPSPNRLDEAFLILPPLALFALTSALADNLGVRYILPIYPFVFVFAGRAAVFFLRRRAGMVLLALLGLWQMGAAIRIYPDYIAFFNEPAGGPERGYRWLDDSNLEWGQDLKRLKAYMDENGIEEIKLFYFGNALPQGYGIKLAPFTEHDWKVEPSPGYYAVSIQTLVRGKLQLEVGLPGVDWLDRFEPVGRVAYSFYIYKFP